MDGPRNPKISKYGPPGVPIRSKMSRYVPLICLALTHTLVDTVALLIAPLWPELKSSFTFTPTMLLVAFVVQALPTSVSQMVFGYLRDRRATPLWLLLGPILAAVFLTLIGAAPNTAVLLVLLFVGGIGVGAFHPEAAVTAGRMFPENRTRALSVFMFGGSLGLALGPLLGGFVVSQWGLVGLAYLGAPIVVLVWLLRRIGRLGDLVEATSRTEATPRTKPVLSIGQMLEGRGRLALAIFLICSLRLVPNMAMDKVLAFTLSSRGYSTFEIGKYQSLFLASASMGMFVMVFRFRPGWEKGFMVACPLVGIPLLFLLGLETCPQWLFVTLLVLTGITLWGTTPAMVSYAQQLFPKAAGVASAITMGLAWGLATLIQAPITAHFQATEFPQHAFYWFLPCLALAAIGAWFLPASSATRDVREEVQPESVDA